MNKVWLNSMMTTFKTNLINVALLDIKSLNSNWIWLTAVLSGHKPPADGWRTFFHAGWTRSADRPPGWSPAPSSLSPAGGPDLQRHRTTPDLSVSRLNSSISPCMHDLWPLKLSRRACRRRPSWLAIRRISLTEAPPTAESELRANWAMVSLSSSRTDSSFRWDRKSLQDKDKNNLTSGFIYVYNLLQLNA